MRPEPLVLVVLATLSCSSKAVVEGKLIAPDGRTGAVCDVQLHYEVGDPGPGLRCHAPGATKGPDASVVSVGQTFECITVAGAGAIDVTAACDGYEPYRSSPITWKEYMKTTWPKALDDLKQLTEGRPSK